MHPKSPSCGGAKILVVLSMQLFAEGILYGAIHKNHV